jgi:redox-sensitive bicupin YhaK (pirin superfamily)
MQTTVPTLQIFDRTTQDRGSFDAGRITEYKVIGMPQDRTVQKRVGPLFYWSWATGEPDAVIALHPHQGFEIFSYVINGSLIHRDTLGSQREVHAGGLQLMQTGSGVSHEEVIGANGTEFFQIWVEPHLRQAMAQPPTYQDFAEPEFPLREASGVHIKQILGANSPARLAVPVVMLDVELQPQATFTHDLQPNGGVAALTVYGTGTWHLEQESDQAAKLGDMAILQNPKTTTRLAVFTSHEATRLVLVDVPLTVNYPLYPQ